MIVSGVTNKNNSTTQNFTAIPLAKYRTEPNRFVSIYQLEKQDLPFIRKFLKNITQYFKDKKIEDYSRKQIMQDAFYATKEILESPITDNFARPLIAISNGKPCGILIGSVAKKSNSTNKIVYSSRKNKGRRETEIDWLTTWSPNPNKKIKNIGKALTTEFYNTVLKDGFKRVYVRSELPELSSAIYFYKSVGFKELSSKRKKIVQYQTNKYLFGNLENPKEEIIPMTANRSSIIRTKNIMETKFGRTKLTPDSKDIETLITDSQLT